MGRTVTWDDLLHPGEAVDFFARRSFPAFDPDMATFTTGNALWLAELSRLVYRDPPLPLPPGNAFPAGTSCVRHSFFVSRATDTQAMLFEFGGTMPFAVLAFRGTEQNIRDIVTDLEFGKHSFGRARVAAHEGFMEALDSVWYKIEKELDALTVPVFFTGHSLGGALAILAAARRMGTAPPKALYTFGAPRVGNSAFAASLNRIAGTIHQIIDDEDIVPRLPPEKMGYANTSERQIELPAPAGHTSHNFILYPPKPLADHAPINYVDRI